MSLAEMLLFFGKRFKHLKISGNYKLENVLQG